MMLRQSPPKHRHDGTSPLPLGMDWSPPPRKWNGRDTIWPHDFHTGWSYCVTIPSWTVLPKTRNADPVVFYRVQIALQSPEGVTTTRGVLRRFNDFLKLFADLKKSFPKKSLPAAPPKGLLRMKSRALLEERRCSLELWMNKLLSDIIVSRSFIVASFLELEAAARSSFQDLDHQTSQRSPASSSSTSSSLQLHPYSNLSLAANTSSIMSDYGSDTAYETSELGSPRLGRDTSSEIGTDDLTLDDDMTNPIEKLVKYGISNIDQGLFMGRTILDQLEGPTRKRMHAGEVSNHAGKDLDNGNVAKSGYLSSLDGTETLLEADHGKLVGLSRNISTESVGNDFISFKGSEMSNLGISNSISDSSVDYPGSSEASKNMERIGNKDLQFSGDTQLVLPMDLHHKVNRILMTMQRRLVTAKTDMEDLVARLNQEIAVKDYLMTKVKDLEVELQTTKQKGKDNLEQAILLERGRVTQMQWDMEELRQKSLALEQRLKHEKDENSHSEPTKNFPAHERDELLQELEATKEQLKNILKRHEELGMKSKSDIKVLVKEVKSVRRSQADLKQQLAQSLKEKAEAERLLEEKQRCEHAKPMLQRLLHDSMVLWDKLQECNTDIISEDEHKILPHSSPAEALDLLTTSDNRIGLLLKEIDQAKLVAEESVQDNSNASGGKFRETNGDAVVTNGEEEVQKIVKLILLDNAKLRKQMNFITRHALEMTITSNKDDVEAPTNDVLSKVTNR